MTPRIHAIAGALALLLIASFLTMTLVSELLLDHAAVVTAKTAIVWGVLILIPLVATTGGSGFFLAKGRSGPLLDRKKKRMRIVAANGLFILLPAAIYLWMNAMAGRFDQIFYVVQGLELAAGIVQFSLLALNFRDGWRMTAKSRQLKRMKATTIA